MNQHRSKRPLPTHLHPVKEQRSARAELEQFIFDLFKHNWNAEVREFMPCLLGLRDDAGELLGVLGIRETGEQPLFLEQYLDQPVEQLLSQRIGAPIARNRIVEVGNLAVAHPGGGRWLITALTAFLQAGDAEWVVFTGGPVLRNAFLRLGMNPLVLADADPSRLADGGASWGSYYEQQPQVMAQHVGDAYAQLRELLVRQSQLQPLWNSADQAGHRQQVAI